MLPPISSRPGTCASATAALLEIEQEYGVSLGMWLELREDPIGTRYLEVCVSGGGDLYDRLPSGQGVGSGRIISAFDDPLGAALLHALAQLESQLARVFTPQS